MATLALGVAGAGIGSATGVGAGTGWLVGTTLGRVLFPEDSASSPGPRLSDLKITGASYGAPIPRLYGTMRLCGNIIWASDLRSETVTSGGGGKGGSTGAAQSTGYAYYTSFAVAISEGEVASLLKIWADGKVIYDASAAGEVIAADVRFRFYTGDEAQLPDSIIEAVEGEGDVPAYRGLCYLVFDDLPLAAYGNRIPNIEVLVTTEGLGAWPLTDSTISSVNASSFAYDADRGLAFSYEVIGGVDTVRKIDTETLEQLASAEIETEFPRLLDAAQGFSRDRKGVFWIGTGAALLAGRKIHRVDGEALVLLDSVELPSGVGAVTFSTDVIHPLTGAQFQVAGSQQSYQVVVFDEALEVVETIATSSRVCTGALTDESEVAWVAMSGWATGPQVSDLEIVRVSVFSSQGVDATDYSVMSEIFTIPATDLTPLGGTGSETNTITRMAGYLPASDELVFQNDYRIFKWSMASHAITVSRDVSDLSGDLSLVSTNNGSELVFVSSGRYAVYLSAETLEELERADLYNFTGVSASVNGIYDAASDSLIAFNSSFGVKRLFLRREDGSSADLAAIVTDLCSRAGLTSYDIDVASLDAEIPGYVVNRPMSVADALTPLSQYVFFDAVESGYKLMFIPRNSGDSGIVIEVSDMLAPPDLRRLQESELPERISLSYLAADAGYQVGTQMEKRSFRPVATMFGRNQLARDLPMALSADQARQAAAKTLYAAWAERQTLGVSLPLKFLALDPADVVTVSLNSGAASARLMQSHFGADMTLEAEAVTLSPLAYSSSLTSDAGSGYEQVLIRRGSYAELFLLDLPLLRDQDATAGTGSRFYFAMDGYQSGWSGGALYSAFEEQGFELEGSIANEVVWGVTLAALANTATPWQTDTVSTIDIRFISGGDELESITEAELLNGGNALLIGDEIVQFADVSLNADGSYRLSTFIRGRRGTEGAISGHKVGERAILLRPGDIGGGFSALGDLNVPRFWKAVGAGRLIEEVPATIKALTGKDLMPYAPVQIAGTRISGDLALSWQRRTRVGGGSLSGIVPLSEASERYELVFTHGGASVSKFVYDATEYIYPVSEFNADFAASESEVPELGLTLYQLSQTIGRGFPATEII
ncbi:MAG: phage tail protein [Sneathiella sp.]|nr:phage tail protein [Sneathiella sp.]